MGAVQRLATVVIVGLVALATVLVLYLADESNRIEHEQEEQEEAAIERGRSNYITLCMQCHGPAGEGAAAAGEAGTGRIGLPIGGGTYATALNQQGITTDGSIWSDPEFGSGVEGRANWIRNRIINGQITSNGTVVMPAFGEDKNGPLNDEQVEELIVFIQHSDWNETYNEAVAEYGGYPTALPAPTQAGEGEGETTDAEAPNPDAAALTVTMYDNYFEPTMLSIPPDQDVTINLVNAGNSPHIFRIDDPEFESAEIPGGGTGSITINLPGGTYQYRCPVPGHTELGMVGDVTADANAPAPGGEPAPAETPPPDPAAAEEAPPEGEPAEGQAAAGGPISVEMTDTYQFVGVPETIPANTDVTFSVVNVGVQQHNLAIEGQELATPILDGGGTADLTVNLPPGTYTYICEVPGHKELGMVGTLTVQ